MFFLHLFIYLPIDLFLLQQTLASIYPEQWTLRHELKMKEHKWQFEKSSSVSYHLSIIKVSFSHIIDLGLFSLKKKKMKYR